MDRGAQPRRDGSGRGDEFYDRSELAARRRRFGPADFRNKGFVMARILVAEDDENVRAFVTRALAHMGHEVTEAEDGGLAAEICAEKNGEFDLLLSDIKMPVMDGIALALTVAAQFPELTILLMTGFADQRERAHGLEALIYDVVPQPFSLQVLLEKVDDALRRKPIELPSMSKLAG